MLTALQTKWLLSLVGLLVALVFAAIRAIEFLPAMQLRESIFDSFQRDTPRPIPSQSPIALVAIDDDAMDRGGQWPWPRSEMAELVENLFVSGAAMIVIDINFAHPDRFGPEQISRLLSLPQEQLRSLPETDQRLAEALALGPTVLASFRRGVEGGLVQPSETVIQQITIDGSASTQALPKFAPGYFSTGQEITQIVPIFEDLTDPLPLLIEQSYSVANTMVASDFDGVLRRVPLVVATGDGQSLTTELRFLLSLEAARVATGQQQYFINSHPTLPNGEPHAFKEFRGIDTFQFSGRDLPVDAQGRLRVYESETVGANIVSAAKFLNSEQIEDDAKTAVSGKIVFIGLRTLGTGDRATGPLGIMRRGIDFQVLLTEQFFSGKFVTEPALIRFWEIGLILMVAIALLVLSWFSFIPSWIRFPIGLTLVCGPLVVSYLAFANAWFAPNPTVAQIEVRLLIDGSLATISGFCILLVSQGGEALLGEVRQRRLKTMFARYLGNEVATELSKDGSSANDTFKPQQTELTVMFVDIRGFTTLSESLSAQETVKIANLFLTEISQSILDHGGTIDKFLGDGAMAFWNAPTPNPCHREDSIACARDIVTRIRELNRTVKLSDEWCHIFADKDLKVGVGINTGLASVGNFGSDKRLDYSCLGDTVNTAARIEGLCKDFKANILVSAETISKANKPNLWELQDLGPTAIRGKTERVHLFNASI